MQDSFVLKDGTVIPERKRGFGWQGFIFCIIPLRASKNDVLRIQNGFEFSWLMVMYLIGGYFSKYPVKINYIIKDSFRSLLVLSQLFICCHSHCCIAGYAADDVGNRLG